MGGVPRHQELPPGRAGQAPGRAARGHRVGVGPRGLQARALLYRAQRQGGLRKQAALCWAGSGDRGRDARRAGAVDGRQRDAVRREETDSAAPEPPAAATDEGATEGSDTGLGTAEEWARLFTQSGQEESEATADDPGEEEAKPLLLVAAVNGFSNLSRLAMLWTILHGWPKMARFAFNAYRHKRRLHVRCADLNALIILSMEGVTQGGPLAMALYGVALLPLIEHLRWEHPRVLHPWYADGGAMRGTGRDMAACFHKLCRVVPQYGYFPEPAKFWAVCAQEDRLELRRSFAVAKLPMKGYCG